MKRTTVLVLFIISLSINIFSKNDENIDLFSDCVLKIDTFTFSKLKNCLTFQNENFLYFQYNKENEVCQVKLIPSVPVKIKKLQLEELGDYDIIDSIASVNNSYWDFKVRFKHLTKSEYLKFRLLCTIDSTQQVYDLKLYPITKTSALLNQTNDELVVGEEKAFELTTNNIENLKYNADWDNSQDIGYRIVQVNNQLYAHFNANAVGKKNVILNFSLNKPYLQNGKPVFTLPPLQYTFNVKSAGLIYVQTDKPEIVLDEKAKSEGVSVQFDNGRLIQLQKTYIVDAQESPGSSVIATLYAKERLANNKILCNLHIYNLHRQNEGYLYIKDSDDPKFLTNLNIIPKTTIERIKIMRNGKDWIEDNNIYPGETLNLRLEGQSLNKGKFTFDALIELANDSVIKNENFIEYKLKVPLNISKKLISIFNYNQNTGKSLSIKEFQVPRPFDYVNISFGERTKSVTHFQGPELYDKSLKDIFITFKPDKIDGETTLYGKQYFDIDIKVFNDKGELTDFATITDVAICPGENSPRNGFYDKSDCSTTEISLNSKLNSYIYNLKDWSKIKLTFRSQKDKYTKDLQTKSVEIILQKHYSFDIDVSFPTGLLIKKAGEGGFGNFSGVSMAVIAQVSFYDENKIAKFRPYKLGLGFIAINAFDFSTTNRDMGLVAIGTIYPVTQTRKLSFPIYLGGGYLLEKGRFFWLVGPGISVQF